MFFSWWLRQLSELLPNSLAWRAAQPADAAILQVDNGSISLLIRRGGETARAAGARADEAGFRQLAKTMTAIEGLPHLLIVRFPPATILQKRISFPVAARRDLDGLIGFEMDRETPFARDEVYWSYVLDRQDASATRLDITLFIAPRAYVDPTLEAARAAGLQPTGIEVGNGEPASAIIRIGAAKRFRWLQTDRPLIGLAAAAGVLLLLAIITPFIRQQLALASADRTIDSLTEQAREAASLRQSVDQASGAIGFINKERERNGSVLTALAMTTRLLPDDTHLTALSLRGGRLTITGLSPSAAHLVDLLGQSSAFREPAFDSPVVQEANGGLETFTISATLTRTPGS